MRALPRTPGSLNGPSSMAAHQPELVRIAGGTALISVATFFGLGLSYLYSIILARYLGPDVYGLYALGLAAFNLISVIAMAGLDNATLKFVPALVETGDEPGLRRTVRIILGLSLVSGGLLCVALLLGSHTVAAGIFKKSEMTHVLRIMALGIPAYVVSSVLITILQALQDVRWRTFVKYVSEPVVRVLISVVLLWAGWSLDAALVAFVAALTLSVILTLVSIRSLLAGSRIRTPVSVSTREILAYSTPLLLALLVSSIAVKVDFLILGYWRSAGDVGIYSAAFQTAAIMALVTKSFESIGIPFLSRAIAGGDRIRLARLYKTLLRWTLTASLPVFLLIAIFSRDILSFFGSQFEEGALCLVILSVGQIIYAGTGTANNILLLAGYSRWVMWNGLSIGLLQMALNLALIPRYGIIGAAIAAGASQIIVNLIRVVEAWQLVGVHPFEWDGWKPITAGAMTFGSVWLLEAWLQPHHFLLGAGLMVLFYAVSLAVLGFNDDDVAVLREAGDRFRRAVAVFE